MAGTVRGATLTVGPGHNGYAGFRLTYDYYEGVLPGDCVKDVNAGGSVSAEGLGERDGFPIREGTISFISANATNSTTKYATAKPRPSPESLASSGRTQWGVASIYDDGLMVP